MAAVKNNPELENIAGRCAGVVVNIFKNAGRYALREKPDVKRKNIMDFEDKMRVSGLDLFNETAYLSAFCYYASDKAKGDRKPCGTLTIYIAKALATIVFKALGYRGFDDEDDASMLEQTGKFAQTIAEGVSQELASMGYGQLLISEPESHLNYVPLGIDFCKDQIEQVEMTFVTKEKEEKVLIADISMEAVKK